MIRRARLQPGPWNRKPPKRGTERRELYELHRARQQAARRREKALTWGCEYLEFLRGWYRLNGCAACGRSDPAGPHLHHTAHRSRKGRADTLVPLCPTCHTEDGRGIEAKAAQDHGVDLFVRAAEFALAGTRLEFLPTECCAHCGEYHSRRYMLDEVDQSTGVTSRICGECAPEGPI